MWFLLSNILLLICFTLPLMESHLQVDVSMSFPLETTPCSNYILCYRKWKKCQKRDLVDDIELPIKKYQVRVDQFMFWCDCTLQNFFFNCPWCLAFQYHHTLMKCFSWCFFKLWMYFFFSMTINNLKSWGWIFLSICLSFSHLSFVST